MSCNYFAPPRNDFLVASLEQNIFGLNVTLDDRGVPHAAKSACAPPLARFLFRIEGPQQRRALLLGQGAQLF